MSWKDTFTNYQSMSTLQKSLNFYDSYSRTGTSPLQYTLPTSGLWSCNATQSSVFKEAIIVYSTDRFTWSFILEYNGFFSFSFAPTRAKSTKKDLDDASLKPFDFVAIIANDESNYQAVSVLYNLLVTKKKNQYQVSLHWLKLKLTA